MVAISLSSRRSLSCTALAKPLGAAKAHPAGASAGPRAENEDDDGYDPYSDYHDGTAGAP